MDEAVLTTLKELQKNLTTSNFFVTLLTIAWFLVTIALPFWLQRVLQNHRNRFEEKLENTKVELQKSVSRLEAELDIVGQRHLAVIERRSELLENIYSLCTKLRRTSKAFQNKPYLLMREGENPDENLKLLEDTFSKPLQELGTMVDDKVILLREEEFEKVTLLYEKAWDLFITHKTQQRLFENARSLYEKSTILRDEMTRLNAEDYNKRFEEETKKVGSLQQELDSLCDLVKQNFQKEFEPWIKYPVKL
jgi:hypothetical protein